MTAVARRIGLGCLLGVDTAGGSSYVNLGSIVDGFSGPSAKSANVNVSLLSEVFDTFRKGSIDGGEMQLSILYDPADATSTTLNALFSSVALTLPSWQITFTDPASGASTGTGVVLEHFNAYVAGISREIKKD